MSGDHVRDATEKVENPVRVSDIDTTTTNSPTDRDLYMGLQADFDRLVAHCVTIGIGANAIKRILEGK